MIHASLCTGIGACELAASWLGWDNAFSCEIDAFCQRVLKYYYPNSKHYGNIYETDFSKWRGKIDVLTAGFPCQPFSCAGSRKGAEDDRYLWPEVLRVIGEIRPTWFIGENVAGITSMVLPGDEIEVGSYKDIFDESYQETEVRQQFVIDRICDDLESIGYSVQPIVIPACAVGAPHRRDRIWFIANRADTGLESVQQEWQDGIHEFSHVTYTDRERCDDRGNNWQKRQFYIDKKRYSKKVKSKRTERKYRISPHCPFITNAPGTGLQNRIISARCQNEKENNTRQDARPKRYGKEWITSNANCELLSDERRDKQDITIESFNFSNCWEKFPTQSPVCGRDDGIPDKLSGITVPQWITESTKAYGNTMVPQVVYQIFKCIEEIEKQSNF